MGDFLRTPRVAQRGIRQAGEEFSGYDLPDAGLMERGEFRSAANCFRK